MIFQKEKIPSVLSVKQIYGGIDSYRTVARYRISSCLASFFSLSINQVGYVNPLVVISHIKLCREKVNLVENECR